MSVSLKPLKGFRDFLPETCAVRNYIFACWRSVAGRYGFSEWEGPVLEPTDLYRKKSGDEITAQLFNFEDKGEREVAMRPELTPSLARIVAREGRAFKKPLKWFEIGQCFRYEAPQDGRLREFYQFNCDIFGEASPAADAELVALAVDLVRELGFSPDEVTVRLSDRAAWVRFAEEAGLTDDRVTEFLQIIDKMERAKEETPAKLEALGISMEKVEAFMADPSGASEAIGAVVEDLTARGMADYITVDLGIVRGLAYYTGVVFEVFDKKLGKRAVAGGGRYDDLCELIGGRKAAMPACGFAMGDVVIASLIELTPKANAKLTEFLSKEYAPDAYVVVAAEERRADALALVQKLRTAGLRVDYAMVKTKIPKQFQAAEYLQARAAVVVGDSYPTVQVKRLADRSETEIAESALISTLEALRDPDLPPGTLLA